MKAKLITYSRLISKGNYENAKIEIAIELEDGEKADDVFAAAKQFVDHKVEIEKMSEYAIQKARLVIADRRNHTIAQVEEAEEVIKKYDAKTELPF